MSGYDHWKMTEPDPDEFEGGVCEKCGNPLTKDAWPSRVWFCERCDEHIDIDAARDSK